MSRFPPPRELSSCALIVISPPRPSRLGSSQSQLCKSVALSLGRESSSAGPRAVASEIGRTPWRKVLHWGVGGVQPGNRLRQRIARLTALDASWRACSPIPERPRKTNRAVSIVATTREKPARQLLLDGGFCADVRAQVHINGQLKDEAFPLSRQSLPLFRPSPMSKNPRKALPWPPRGIRAAVSPADAPSRSSISPR